MLVDGGQRSAAAGGVGHRRVMATKREVEDELRTYLTDEGVRDWWTRTRPWPLEGRTPQEVWDSGDQEAVLDAARGGREMGGT